MLYLMFSDGTVNELPEAASGYLDEEVGCLICLDEDGEEVARFPKLSVNAFSKLPFPEITEE